MDYRLTGVPLPLRICTAVPMSDAELLHFCVKNEGLPIERDAYGEIIVMSPTGARTSFRNAELTYQLSNWDRQAGRGIALDSNAGFTLPDGSMRSPHAAWIASARWDALTSEQQEGFAPICPDFIVELRSPSDALPDLHAKMEMWIRNGVQLAWLLDPEERTVTIYRPGHAPETLANISQVSGEGPVSGFTLPLARIFM